MRKLAVLILLPFVQADPAAAHHAFAADYDESDEGTIEGVITEVVYRNPHARYYLEVETENGGTELWDLQTQNLSMLGRVGWTRETLKVGDRVTVQGGLGRNDTRRMLIKTVTFADGRVLSPQRGIGRSTAELNAGGGTVVEPAGEFESVASNVTSGRYELDETHAYLSFSYSHLGLSNPQLQFAEFTVDLGLDGKDMKQSNIAVTIDAASIASSVAELDAELRGAEFFDVVNHPQITFRSTAYQEASETEGRLTGDLSVRGVTRPVTLDVTINSAAMNPLNRKEMIGISATGTVKRSDFGLTAYAPMVGDELSLNIQVEFEKAQ